MPVLPCIARQALEHIMTEHEHSHAIKVPLAALIGAALVLFSTIAAVAVFRLSGQEPTARVPEPDQVIESRQLRFVDSAGGTVSVYELAEGAQDQLLHVIQPGDGGFIRGVLRSLARARRAGGIGDEHPFLLIQQANGTLLLEDPMTEQRIYLQAFGSASIESFQAFLSGEISER